MKNRNSSSYAGFLNLGMSSEGPKAHRPSIFFDIGGAGNEVQVNQVTWIREAQLHERDEALTTSEKLGLVP
jgi:hypothetical protein